MKKKKIEKLKRKLREEKHRIITKYSNNAEETETVIKVLRGVLNE